MRPIGVYVHFPFCLKKCPYCDFVSFARERERIDHAGYAGAVLAELERRRPALEDRLVQTIFFGGGTPSLWEPVELGRVLRAVLAAAGAREDDVEITVECNPTSLDEARARALVAQGAGTGSASGCRASTRSACASSAACTTRPAGSPRSRPRSPRGSRA